MEQRIDNKIRFKEKIINIYKFNKVKIFLLLIVLLIIFFSVYLIKYKNDQNNILISEKYIKAGIFLSSKDNEKAKLLYEEIILSNNEFYSLLAMNNILEKNLISDKKKILGYFNLLNKNITKKENKDLVALKKALYLIKVKNDQEGKSILKKLIDKNSNLNLIAKEIIEE